MPGDIDSMPDGDPVDYTYTITIRVSQNEGKAIKDAAYRNLTSMNKMCRSVLLNAIEHDAETREICQKQQERDDKRNCDWGVAFRTPERR